MTMSEIPPEISKLVGGRGEGSVLEPLMFLVQILELSVVMNLVWEEPQQATESEVTELSTAQFADDCTNIKVSLDYH